MHFANPSTNRLPIRLLVYILASSSLPTQRTVRPRDMQQKHTLKSNWLIQLRDWRIFTYLPQPMYVLATCNKRNAFLSLANLARVWRVFMHASRICTSIYGLAMCDTPYAEISLADLKLRLIYTCVHLYSFSEEEEIFYSSYYCAHFIKIL